MSAMTAKPNACVRRIQASMCICLCLCVSLVLVSPSTLPASAGAVPFADVQSYRTLRYEHVMGQLDWFTCGAAAVATWLTHFLGRPASEGEILSLSAGFMEVRGRDVAAGLTLLSLKEALESRGVTAAGYRVSVEGLTHYFQQGGLPLLLHVSRPQSHYLLGVGLVGDALVVADPSYGRHAIPLKELTRDKGFDGIVLAALVDETAATAARRAQEAFVGEFSARFARLDRLKAVVRF